MKGFSEVIRHKLQSNKIFFHSIEHVLISILKQLLLQVLLSYLGEVFGNYGSLCFDFGSCSIISGDSFGCLVLLWQVLVLFLK